MQMVWRMEDEYGRGPYQELYKQNWKNVPHTAERNRPGPYADGLVDYLARDMLFGFRTLTKAKRWFTTVERRRLANLGFTLQRVPADRVIDGNTKTQCIFRRALTGRRKY